MRRDPVSNKRFTIKGYPRDPVAAGTTVRLTALLDGRLHPSDHQIDWLIVGPRSTDTHPLVDRGAELDFVPPVPGGYTVIATRRPCSTGTQAGGGGGTGGAGGTTGAGGSGAPLPGLGPAGPSAGPVLARPQQPGQGDGINAETEAWDITAQ